MILSFLQKEVPKNKKILDAGCGEGRFSKYFIEEGYPITSMDFSIEYVKMDKKKMPRGKFVVGSVTDMPFKSNSFDCIFCVDVLQHVPDLEKAIKEFRRVLKKGGKLILIDKNKYGLHKKYMIPKILIQKYRQIVEWRYSGFKERWFSPKKFNKLISKYFEKTEYHYLMESKKNFMFRLFPKLNLYVVWSAIK
jgi:ubiquinone/menaquinone biosynthesis C-methylase UbiE